MPMVSESSNSPNRLFTVRNGSTVYSPLSLPDGRNRSQLGYRTNQLTKEEELAIYPSSVHGNIASLLGHYDDLYDVGMGPSSRQSPNRAWPVHDRDYTCSTYRPTGFTSSTVFSGASTNPQTRQGAVGFTGFTYSNAFTGGVPSDSFLQNTAGKLLRGAKPSAAGLDILRFAGEQRDAGALFRASNYLPRNPKQMAGAYLNYLFGLKPTGEDLGRLAELVMRTDKPVRLLIEGEKIRQKTKRTVTLYEKSGGYVSTSIISDMGLPLYNWTNSPFSMRGAYLVPFSGSGFGSTLAPILNYNWTARQTLRQFATWEMFVPRPLELESRLYSYKERAQLILSAAKLKESAVWELTPWTWLSDWFVDIGGLLRYQRAIVDDQIVATQAGYSLFEEFGAQCNFSGRKYTYNPSKWAVTSDNFSGVSCSIHWRRHKRRGASPFSIGPTWSLTNKQWAILGALGLSKGADLPNIRV